LTPKDNQIRDFLNKEKVDDALSVFQAAQRFNLASQTLTVRSAAINSSIISTRLITIFRDRTYTSMTRSFKMPTQKKIGNNPSST
jgi:hypothetical protein